MREFPNRRKVLKSIGIGSTGLVLPQTASATKGNGKNKFVGIKYNPRNDDVLGKISGRISRSEENISGVIDLNNRKLSLNNSAESVRSIPEMDTPANFDERLSQFSFTRRGKMSKYNGKNAENEYSMKVNVSSISNEAVSGLISHSIQNQKEAFILRRVTGRRTESDIVETMKQNRGGEQ